MLCEVTIAGYSFGFYYGKASETPMMGKRRKLRTAEKPAVDVAGKRESSKFTWRESARNLWRERVGFMWRESARFVWWVSERLKSRESREFVWQKGKREIRVAQSMSFISTESEVAWLRESPSFT